MNSYRDLIIGWVLGVFSPLVVDGVQKRIRARRFERTFRAELAELQIKMAMVAQTLYSHLCIFDRSFLVWLTDIVDRHEGPERLPQMVDSLKNLLTRPDQEILAVYKAKRTESKCRQLSTYSLPFFSAQVQLLSECPIDFQKRVIQIQTQLDQYNSDAEKVDELIKMSFDTSIVGENRKAIEGNLEDAYQRSARRAERIAKLIGDLPA